MKKLILAAALFLSLNAFAEEAEVSQAQGAGEDLSVSNTMRVWGSGTSYGFCGGAQGWFCLDQLKQQARQMAMEDAGRNCSVQQGRLEPFSESCSEMCTPFELQPSEPAQNVNCQSNCNASCVISN